MDHQRRADARRRAAVFHRKDLVRRSHDGRAAAFSQAQSSLRWFVDNFPVIADWRATLLRVATFREALTSPDQQREFESHIEYVDGEPGKMTFDNLDIVSKAGWGDAEGASRRGGRGRSCVDRGRPRHRARLSCSVRSPAYGPGATARSLDRVRSRSCICRTARRICRAEPCAKCWPIRTTTERFDAAAFGRALERLGLAHLTPQLDATRRWDRELSQDEQQALAFARIVLQAPPWVLMDDALGALDDEALERITDVFSHELQQTAVINIGRAAQATIPCSREYCIW